MSLQEQWFYVVSSERQDHITTKFIISTAEGEEVAEFFVSEDIKGLVPHKDETENSILENSIIKKGIEEALIFCYYQDRLHLIDGHNRLFYAVKLDTPFKMRILEGVSSFEDIEVEVINIQLGRRNLSDIHKRYIIGKYYTSHKPKRGGNTSERSNIAKKIAEKHNISESTIYNSANLHDATEKIRKVNPILIKNVLNGRFKVSHRFLDLLSKEPDNVIASIQTWQDIHDFMDKVARKEAAKPENTIPKYVEIEHNAEKDTHTFEFFTQKPSKVYQDYNLIWFYSNKITQEIWEQKGLQALKNYKNSSLFLGNIDDMLQLFLKNGIQLCQNENDEEDIYSVVHNGEIVKFLRFTPLKPFEL